MLGRWVFRFGIFNPYELVLLQIDPTLLGAANLDRLVVAEFV